LGLQDAVNLGWKLAQVCRGISPESLLDTYRAERHPIVTRALKATMAQTALARGDERTKALRETLSELVTLDEPRKRYAGMISGLDIRYDFGVGHPLLGRRMPDLELSTGEGARRLFTLLHAAKPVFINLGETPFDLTGWADRIEVVQAHYEGAWELPVVGTVTAPAAVLIRPDGHVVWTSEDRESDWHEALSTWFGAPTSR
jgi:hypothetical protein